MEAERGVAGSLAEEAMVGVDRGDLVRAFLSAICFLFLFNDEEENMWRV